MISSYRQVWFKRGEKILATVFFVSALFLFLTKSLVALFFAVCAFAILTVYYIVSSGGVIYASVAALALFWVAGLVLSYFGEEGANILRGVSFLSTNIAFAAVILYSGLKNKFISTPAYLVYALAFLLGIQIILPAMMMSRDVGVFVNVFIVMFALHLLILKSDDMNYRGFCNILKLTALMQGFGIVYSSVRSISTV